MGWVIAPRNEGESCREFFERELWDVHIVELEMVDFCAYLAVEDDRGVYALICLLDRHPDEYPWQLGYKDMGEGEQPHYYNCPGWMLDLLDEPRSAEAAQWRRLCRERCSASRTSG
jgi:hypothetical protein